MKSILLKKGMKKEEVNSMIFNYIELQDEVFLGGSFSHRWKCKCGNDICKRSWSKIRHGRISCNRCKDLAMSDNIKKEVELNNEYLFIHRYRKDEALIDGTKVNTPRDYIRVKHKYCGSEYDVKRSDFILYSTHCKKCCGSYENSFAHHIEVELGEPLEKYWDFEKNMVNPYHIVRNFSMSTHNNGKVWIKCQEKDYHESYSIRTSDFLTGKRCGYCGNHKVHPKDSFAQYHIDNTDEDFLEKYWDCNKNKIDPWEVSVSSGKKVWIKCQDKDYHDSYEIRCYSFTSEKRCSYCASYNIHPYDSFGYNNFDKVQSWHSDNDISPFRVARHSGKIYKFICPGCECIHFRNLNKASTRGVFCKECSMSEGEKKITEWLRYNGIIYEYEKEYDGLVGVGGGSLSYDFYLVDYNMLIEYQGEQHEKYIPGFHEGEYRFTQQQEHDRRKREYAKENGIRLLEIWYYDFDNIEEILERELSYGC